MPTPDWSGAGGVPAFEAFFKHAFDATLLFDHDWRTLAANPAAMDLLAAPREQVVGRTLVDLVDPTDQGELVALAHMQVAFREGHSRGELRFLRPGQPSLTVDVGLVLLDGGPRLGFLRDLTTKRQGELQLRLFSKVFDSSSEGVLITDEKNDIISANDAFARMTGYRVEDVLGRNPRLLSSGRHTRSFYLALWEKLQSQGRWQGEIWNRRRNGEVFPQWVTISALKDGRGRVQNYIALFSDISEIKASEAQVAWMANHDTLTSLPNRTLLRDRLNQALLGSHRSGEHVALLVVGLDGFKTINDSLGHGVGDQVLQLVASRIRGAVRQSDTVARGGGDEFVVVVPDLSLDAAAAGVVSSISAAVSQPLEVEGREISLTSSIGVAVYPNDGGDIDTLLRNADAAMYSAKEQGRNGYRFFTADMNGRALERLTIVHALHRAVERKELRLCFQPKYALAGQLVGAEALLRWHNPELGSVSPAKFIPIAEDAGLMRDIGDWVLRAACVQARQWLSAGLQVPVAVNVSPVQLRYDLVSSVTQVLRDTGLEATYLEIELTESTMMREADASARAMSRLRELGVHLAIDDFGTGYSSLSQLRRFPIERLKIDRGFVHDVLNDPSDLEIVRAIINMGHSLRLKVTAEGVETAEQLEVLRQLDCDEAQGYFLGRPMPAEELMARLLSTR